VIIVGAQPLWIDAALFGGDPRIDHEPWARDARIRLRTTDAVTGRPLSAATSLIELGRNRIVAGPVELDGVPGGFVATPVMRESTLTFPDGTSLPTSWASNGLTREVAIDSRYEHWSPLIGVEERQMQQQGDRPAVYTGTFDFVIERRDPIATMPIVEGTGATNGRESIALTRVRRLQDACDLRLTTSAVTLVTQATAAPRLVIQYRLRDGREVSDPTAERQHIAPRPHAPPLYVRGAPSPLEPFTIGVLDSFPTLRDSTTGAPRRPTCDELTLVVSRVSYAGLVTRTLRLENFRLNDPFAGR
jgi:hypothetical protein